MATDGLNEVQLLQKFLHERSANGNGPNTIEEALSQFAKYQAELTNLKSKLQEAEEQSHRGESGPLDAEATKRAVRERLARDGIADE